MHPASTRRRSTGGRGDGAGGLRQGDTRLAQSRTHQGYLGGIKGAAGFKPTPAWAKLTRSEKGVANPMTNQENDGNLKRKTAAAATGDFDTQQELPMPWRPKLDPRRDDKDGGFFTGEAKQEPSTSVGKAAPATDNATDGRDLERGAFPESALTGFAPLEIADGEGGVIQASWGRVGRSRPVLWRAGPGADAWPEWCTLRDARPCGHGGVQPAAAHLAWRARSQRDRSGSTQSTASAKRFSRRSSPCCLVQWLRPPGRRPRHPCLV